jgi:ABC-type cobalamin/Fe3+-siderophores transport system ATPase subunit
MTVSMGNFKFKRLDTIGNPSAESDMQFLTACFVNNGELDVLANCNDDRGIIVGRTGAGKTALLKMLENEEERVISLDLHGLALSYISNSTILKFFEALNIRMDPFYKLLWKHIIVVELLKHHFKLDSEEDKVGHLNRVLYSVLKKKAHQDAFKYLNEWGTSFWETTEDRIKQITQKVESELKASADFNIRDLIKLGVQGVSQLSEEQRREIIQRGQEVINNVQLHKLTLLFNALDEEILTDPKKRYFIVVDRLDEDWVDDSIRYRLVRALIETMKEMNSKISFAKVIVALRADLLDLVLKATTDSGFQDEKYRGLCLSISWDAPTLEKLLDNRVNELVRHRYTGRQVTHRDLLPKVIGPNKEPTIQYMLDRTLLRPRDLITFFNTCISFAEGEPNITVQQLQQAETKYSQERLRSITDEWSAHYPCLGLFCNLLKKRSVSFNLSDIGEDDLADLCVEILDTDPQKITDDLQQIKAYFHQKIKGTMLRVFIAQVLYRVGIVGLKTDSYKSVNWSNNGLNIISSTDISASTTIHVHKMLWRALGISPLHS